MVEIDFSMENIKKCLCTQCNVQIQSQCVKDKEKILVEITMKSLKSSKRPKSSINNHKIYFFS